MVQKIYPWVVIWVPSSPPHAVHFSEIFSFAGCPRLKSSMHNETLENSQSLGMEIPKD